MSSSEVLPRGTAMTRRCLQNLELRFRIWVRSLAIVTKEQAQAWLDEQGTREGEAESSGAGGSEGRPNEIPATGPREEIVITRHGRESFALTLAV